MGLLDILMGGGGDPLTGTPKPTAPVVEAEEVVSEDAVEGVDNNNPTKPPAKKYTTMAPKEDPDGLLHHDGTPYGELYNTYKSTLEKKKDSIKEYYADSDLSDTIKLSRGKFRGVELPTRIIDDVFNAATRAGIDPNLLLGLIGQESTFGAPSTGRVKANKKDLLSGWNLEEDYMPKEALHFLADNKVPGVSSYSDNHGFHAYAGGDRPKDYEAINKYLAANPKLIEAYKAKLANLRDTKDFDYYYEAAKRIKEKGLASYNPGDKKYVRDVTNSMSLVKTDPAIQAYLRKKAAPRNTAKR